MLVGILKPRMPGRFDTDRRPRDRRGALWRRAAVFSRRLRHDAGEAAAGREFRTGPLLCRDREARRRKYAEKDLDQRVAPGLVRLAPDFPLALNAVINRRYPRWPVGM